MNLSQIIQQPEGRRLEFKSIAPTNSDLAKTAVAFANDAGGEIFIGINDNPREIIGLAEDEMMKIEEQISNLIYDRCYPHILPETTFMSENGKNIIRVKIYKGSMPPYYIKKDGKINGTYIRVGSNNRLADAEIITELERRRMNISFDGEVVYERTINELDITSFKKFYKEKTEENIDLQILKKLDLVKTEQGKIYPTNALVLFSDDGLKNTMFPNAKVSCALFKGTTSDEFIDQKEFSGNICLQAEEAYNFVLRNINKNAHVEGVYTVSRWEYPIKAIREVIRNAVVHRQYSLTGKDIKIAIYADMVEVTSPGLLLPSIDYSDMTSRQSDARNKIIAPVFKRLNIIDQWGNGLKLISDELKSYPEIDFVWKEVGMSFQIQFIKKDVGNNVGNNVGDVGNNDNDVRKKILLEIQKNPEISAGKLSIILGMSSRQCERIISSMKADGILSRKGTKNGYWIINK